MLFEYTLLTQKVQTYGNTWQGAPNCTLQKCYQAPGKWLNQSQLAVLNLIFSQSVLQLKINEGHLTFFTSKTMFPSSDFYEQRVDSYKGKQVELFVPQPPTQDEEGIVYCNFKGDDDDNLNVEIEALTLRKLHICCSFLWCNGSSI